MWQFMHQLADIFFKLLVKCSVCAHILQYPLQFTKRVLPDLKEPRLMAFCVMMLNQMRRVAESSTGRVAMTIRSIQTDSSPICTSDLDIFVSAAMDRPSNGCCQVGFVVSCAPCVRK